MSNTIVNGTFLPQPNAADWSGYIEVLDDETGTAYDLTAALVEMEVRDQGGTRYLYGSTDDATLTLAGDGFEFAFTAAQMRGLEQGAYVVNIRFTDNATGYIAEPAIANLPVIEGGYR